MEDPQTYSTSEDSQRPERKSRWHRIRLIENLDEMLGFFSPAERALLYFLSIVLALSTAALLININVNTTEEVASYGDSLTEGVVGTPRFINPLLAASDTDRDLTELVYSGLMRPTPEGTFIPDLAEQYKISEDGRTYTFVLREDVTFHDGRPVTSTDIAYTIHLAQSPDIKSPKRADWEGVAVNEIDERTISFTLPRAYAPFLENTTLGILPFHLWEQVTPGEFPFHNLNTRPVGTGAYRVDSVRTDKSGSPTHYIFKSFSDFALGRPYLSTIEFRFYPNEQSLISGFNNRDIESASGISPANLSEINLKKSAIHQTALPRVFAIFLNQNGSEAFSDKRVRQALDIVLDKQKVVDTSLGGYGEVLGGPIPPQVLVTKTIEGPAAYDKEVNISKAKSLLDAAGWEKNESTGMWEKDDTALSFAIKTSDTPELVATAEEVVRQWQEFGIDVTIEVFAAGNLNTSVIRPREYEALLFGEIVGRTLDLFAFWHSSQRSDPGLNLALYTNSKADSLLSEARIETDIETREEKFVAFEDIVREDAPAVFLYAPEFLYITPENLKGVSLGALTTPAERFLTVHTWHTQTERVWSIFTKN